MPTSPLLLESKYAAGAAAAGFLLALFLSHGSLMAGFGALALIAGLGWIAQRTLRHYHKERENE